MLYVDPLLVLVVPDTDPEDLLEEPPLNVPDEAAGFVTAEVDADDLLEDPPLNEPDDVEVFVEADVEDLADDPPLKLPLELLLTLGLLALLGEEKEPLREEVLGALTEVLEEDPPLNEPAYADAGSARHNAIASTKSFFANFLSSQMSLSAYHLC